MINEKKLRHEQKQEQVQEQHQQQQSVAKEFSSVEEVIRHDVEQTVVPSGIAVRLNESIAREPKPSKSWWKRIFGKS